MSICRSDVVILAAGNGLRLSSLSPLPKPLVTIEARPLLDRVLGALAQARLQQVKIVVGNAADSVRSHTFASADGLDIEWIVNDRYNRPNGISLLCAEGHVRSPFVLLMADHLFQVDTLRRLLTQTCPADGVVLAVDRKLDAIYDIDDATKVATRAAMVERIGKDLPAYDAVDTGMFLCSESIFEAMRRSASLGKESLSDGVATLARAGRVQTWDIGPAVWIDVDTPAARNEAERMVRAGSFGVRPGTPALAPPGAESPQPVVSSRPHRTDRVPRLAQLVPCDDGDLVLERG
jgi:1L-myo-inositol 1-phosphate cytidylyltransferase